MRLLRKKLESNQEFRRRQIAVIMGVIMGCICSSSQHGKKKSAEVFWADEIKKDVDRQKRYNDYEEGI